MKCPTTCLGPWSNLKEWPRVYPFSKNDFFANYFGGGFAQPTVLSEATGLVATVVLSQANLHNPRFVILGYVSCMTMIKFCELCCST